MQRNTFFILLVSSLLIACNENKVQRYFFSSSACAYNTTKQQDVFIEGLKEEDAYPANPEDGYGWEKLFSERMCRHFMEDYGIQVRIARYHNIYGPFGTYDGGREKAPAALCRKIIQAKKENTQSIDVWGDGEQTRTFLFIDECIEGTLKLFESDYSEPINIGSDEQVSINQMIDIITEIAKIKKLDKNGSYSTKTKLFFQKNASKKQLRDIKEKLRKENKKALIRKTAIILILLIILIYCIGFAKF